MLYFKRKLYFLLFLLIPVLSFMLPHNAGAEDAGAIIRKVVDNLNGKSAVLEIIMAVKTSRAERTMKMKSYSIGQEKSFIKILYPGKDKGITFLKIDKSMWQYVPRIEKTIKIPASMMLQSWMGSDFTNDDLVKESSLCDDYDHKLISATQTGYNIELIPRAEAAVVWGKILMAVSREYYLPVTVNYFDEDGVLVRTLSYSKIKHFGARFYPSLWIMKPETPDKAGHETRIIVTDAFFDGVVDDSYFTKRALKRFSR